MWLKCCNGAEAAHFVRQQSGRCGRVAVVFYEFYELGMDEPIALSAIHGTGTGDLLDRILQLAPSDEERDTDTDSIKVAVIGKPNAGKVR